MGNILGLSSAEYVVKQVDLRQEKLGITNNIPDDVLTWSHGKTAWVRLASSVNINGSSNQAKDNVLFGSTAVWSPAGTNESGEQVPKSWLLTAGFNASYPRISSYVSSSFGYRPRPGITSVDVTYLNNNGTLKRAKIKIKVYSPEQLEIIDKLYMRLGYHVLLEWGHTLYLNNDTKNVENFDLFTTKPFNEFFANKTTPTKVLNSIKEEQKKYFGNYEAFYGKIVKFNWTFNEDATYDIDLEIISQGDVIESLLVNSMATIPYETTSSATSSPSGSVSVISLKDASAFNRFLYTTYILTAGTSENYIPGASRVGDLSIIKSVYNIKKWDGKDALILPFAIKDRPHNKQVFIPLGFLLAYLESNQNIFLSKDDPHLFFDVEDSNYCLTFDGSTTGNGPYHVSSDPRICVIPNAFMKNADFHTPELEKFYSGISTIGRVMYIHYNIDYLAKLLLEIRNEKGKVFLGKFLDTILADANRCLGGVNNLTYKIKDDNIVYIVDEAPLDYGSLKSRSIPASFNVFGVRSNQGSFIKNIDFNVTITNDMATTITIGAQANGNQVSQNATALSNFNIGLIDRTEEVRSTSTTPEDVSEQNKQIIELGNRFETAVNSVYNNNVIDSNVIENLVNVNSDLANHIIGRLTNEKNITAPSFLPFDLNLTMVGLSGMKIFERFILTPESEKILPSTYRDNNGNSLIDFLITDLSHKISNNTWETNIKGKTIPTETKQITSPSPTPLPNPIPSPVPSPVPETAQNVTNSTKPLRQIIIDAGYPENTPAFVFALSIGNKEGWNPRANGGKGSRSYRNNNPGNLNYSESYKRIDPNVKLESNPYGKPNRFAVFSTAELGVKALVEDKLKRWARGSMPITRGNTTEIEASRGGSRYVRGTSPTIAQFVYTFAPPSDNNNTEGYIAGLLSDISKIKPDTTRVTTLNNFF